MARGVVYIHRSGLAFFAPPLTTLASIPFSPDSIKDLDVLSEEPLYQAVKKTFTENKIVAPLSFVIVLANDTLFVKNFPNFHPINSPQTPPASPSTPQHLSTQPAVKPQLPDESKKFHEEQEKQIEIFIDRVPFDAISHKIIATPTSRQVIVTNKALYMAVKSVLQRLGCTVEAVVPAMVFGKSVPMSAGFSPASASAMLTHSDIIKQNDLSINPVAQQPIMIGAKPGDEPPPKSRAYILIGVFVLLFLFMIGLYYFMYMRPQPKTATPAKRTTTTKPTLTTVPSPAASPSADLTTLQFQIQGSTGTASLSSRLRTRLTALGVENVTVNTIPISASSTIVIFSSDITEPTRDLVLDEVQGVTPRVSSQITNSGAKRVTVTFGR